MKSGHNGEHNKARGNGNRLPDDDDGLLLSIDWSTLFELSVLCPLAFARCDDEDLDRVYAQCEQGCSIEGRSVFS